MVVIERGQPIEAKLRELPINVPFKYMKGEMYYTYINIVCLNTGRPLMVEDVEPLLQRDITVQAYKDIKVITRPMTESIEISKISCEEINAGDCCIYKDTTYMKTNIENYACVVMFNLETKSFQLFEANDKVLPAPFLCLELI